MGMFDYVKGPTFECPNCSYTEEDYTWQTKQLAQLMGTYEEGKIMPDYLDDELEVHSLCPDCHAFVQGYVKIDDEHRLTNDVRIDEEESHTVELGCKIPIASK